MCRCRMGTFKTACQQACPAEAIVFGNLARSGQPRFANQEAGPQLLGAWISCDTRPRLTYLARIRNPNPNMPDVTENPLNLQEYMDSTNGNPLQSITAPPLEARSMKQQATAPRKELTNGRAADQEYSGPAAHAKGVGAGAIGRKSAQPGLDFRSGGGGDRRQDSDLVVGRCSSPASF